jgi:hypothetical protein
MFLYVSIAGVTSGPDLVVFHGALHKRGVFHKLNTSILLYYEMFEYIYIILLTHNISALLSRRIPTAVSRIQAQVRLYVTCGKLGQVSTRYFCFPCHSFIPLIDPRSSPSITQADTIGQKMTAVMLDSIPLQPHR